METSFSEKLYKHKLQNVNSMINRYNLLSKLTFGGDIKEEPWKPYQSNTTTSTYTPQQARTFSNVKNLKEEEYQRNVYQNKKQQQIDEKAKVLYNANTYGKGLVNDNQERFKAQQQAKDIVQTKYDAKEQPVKTYGNLAIEIAGALPIGYGLGVGKEIAKDTKRISNTLRKTIQEAKQGYYNEAPWTWKPDPKKYYRTGNNREFLDDVINTKRIRVYNANSYANLQKSGELNGMVDVSSGKIRLAAKIFPEPNAYFAKGVPLDGRYNSQKYGNYAIEASDDIPFVAAVNEKTNWENFKIGSNEANYNHDIGSYVKPRQSYGLDEYGKAVSGKGTPLKYDENKIKLYEPHWFYGYKKYNK